MERESGKNLNSSNSSSSNYKERIGGDPLGFSSTTGSTPSSSSPDLVLQWGNKKRLRCMKIQSSTTATAKDVSSGPLLRTSARVDRRVKDGSSTPHLANGHVNLRHHRPASPPPSHRVLRNSEITMRGSSQVLGSSNGVVVQEQVKQHHTGIENKRRNPPAANIHQDVAPRGGSAETPPGHEGSSGHGKKGTGGGGSSSGGSEVIPPAVWPPKFVIALTNKEKEEDFLAIKGSKLPQRPKKRSKYVQRNLNLVSPGAWLCELTLERYEVREKKTSKKRPRGLKAMCSVESDSE